VYKNVLKCFYQSLKLFILIFNTPFFYQSTQNTATIHPYILATLFITMIPKMALVITKCFRSKHRFSVSKWF